MQNFSDFLHFACRFFAFCVAGNNYPYYPYRGKYFDYGYDDDENELDALIMYAGYFGIDESDIMILVDLGYDAMEIEELMYDPVMLKEIVSECREMMACELMG